MGYFDFRCMSDLDPIQAVSDHLNERVKLESPGQLDQSDYFLKKKIKVENAFSSGEDFLNMNNTNLMYRGMFFMNDEARHFLAPALPLAPAESEYFRKNATNANSQQPGQQPQQQQQQQPQQPQDQMPNQSTSDVAQMNSNVSAPKSEFHSSNHVQQPQTVSKAGGNQLTVVKARPHSCIECGKTFLMKHHLTTHLRTHTGERPHSCPECGKTFALKHCLSTHLLLHTSDRPYKCAECNKSFTLKHHLVCIITLILLMLLESGSKTKRT